ncbi:hypothetical protein PALB_18980 [Pseudoalteromonas luteoviolacea B = ATCC 29581]|nr:hypothetical protein PALB_18980 [Pseudoalteromonas luteoviolacea B = ATCC 29581]
MFRAHGEWRFQISGAAIYIQAIGAFNREGVLAFQKELFEKIAPLPPGTLKRAVIDLQLFELSTSDSHDEVKKYFSGVKDRGYEQVDYIGVSPLARLLLDKLWAGTNMPIAFHSDVDAFISEYPQYSDIHAWLKRQ